MNIGTGSEAMEYAPGISQIATLLADPKRSAMLWALIDGGTRGAEELARLVGVTPSSASAHLARLSSAGLLKFEARGRKRFFRLAAPEVGAAVEALVSVSRVRVGRSHNEPLPRATADMRRACHCGEHLGGELAGQLYQRMLAAQWLQPRGSLIDITHKGALGLAAIGIYSQGFAARGGLQVCEGWDGEHPHAGGALGASLMTLFMQSGWLRAREGSRALQVTVAGLRAIRNLASQ
jgi:DNA-binding transcriptional ArsR family regulator